jgi:predicted transcriptional regulator
MTPSVQAASAEDSLLQVMEGLAASWIAAILIRDSHELPVGVISKTDLILAYIHGLPTTAAAKTIMVSPVQACDQQEILPRAIKKMIFSDIHRMFVYKDHPQALVGVLSLSDAARFRSGTCRACLASRIKV